MARRWVQALLPALRKDDGSPRENLSGRPASQQMDLSSRGKVVLPFILDAVELVLAAGGVFAHHVGNKQMDDPAPALPTLPSGSRLAAPAP